MPKEVALVLLGGLATFAVVSIAIIDFFKHRSIKLPSSDPRLEQIISQLALLQQSLDATSLEVERLGEGQRFTTKLLADRAVAPIPQRQPERVVTPH